jgi:hypothetical protein
MSDQRLSWKRLFAEGVVILLSILAAFSIDAWWDVHQERQELQTALRSIEAGFAEHLSQIDARIEWASRDHLLLSNFIETDPLDAANIHPDSTWRTLQSIWRTGTADLNVSFLVAAVDNANLALLKDLTLDQAVGAWRVEVDAVDNQVAQLLETYGEALRALSHHPEVRSRLARPVGAGVNASLPSAPERLEVSGEVMRRVREDDEVMAVAGMKAFQSKIHLLFLRRLLTRADAVHAAVLAAQAR